MATLWRLRQRSSEVASQLFTRQREAEENRRREDQSAIRIQSWFRAEKVRAYIRYLHHCAILIQKHYRAHVDRAIYRQLVQVKLEEMRQRYYDEMASKIQTRWRGYYIRKYIFDFYARKRYLKALAVKNEFVRLELNMVSIQEKAMKERQKLEKEKASKELKARRTHYLLSTEVRPGVYNSSLKKPYPSPKELELRQVKPLSSTERETLEREKWIRALRTGVVDCASNPFERPPSTPLPPIPTATDKPQGPFRDPVEVQSQRFKPLHPSLRVATSYTCVEEVRTKLKADAWTRRVIDEKFLPFSKRPQPYEPLQHTKSSYGRPPYGSKHFREEDQSNNLSEKPFRRFVEPIPLFDQLGKTY